jgi:hypothetical protein
VQLVVCGQKTALLVTSLCRVAIATSYWKARSFLRGQRLLPRKPHVCVQLVLLPPLHNCLRPAWLLPTSPLVLRVWHPRVRLPPLQLRLHRLHACALGLLLPRHF